MKYIFLDLQLSLLLLAFNLPQPPLPPTHTHTHTPTAVTIGFDPDVYNVIEEVGTVTFTVRVLSGSIANDASVLVNFFTSQGSALGMQDMYA